MSESINTLDELLNDPMVQLVMERDHVQPAELRTLLERARGSAADDMRAGHPMVPAAHMVAKNCFRQWLRV